MIGSPRAAWMLSGHGLLGSPPRAPKGQDSVTKSDKPISVSSGTKQGQPPPFLVRPSVAEILVTVTLIPTPELLQEETWRPQL